MTTLSLLPRRARPIPAEHRANFRHLYLDIAWFGVLNGTAISFMAIFATRQGADGFQIGLLNAAPAIVSLAVTLPAGQWLQKQSLTRAVFWTSIWHRIFYLAWIFLPLFLAPYLQVWALVALIFLMSIPGTALAVGFNAMFAEVVPPEWRSHVVGVRNALLALVFIITTLISGVILEWLPFPLGYQVVFAIGFVGAMMSSLHLYLLRLPEEPTRRVGHSLGDWAHPGTLRTWVQELRLSVGLRFLARGRLRPSLNLHIWRTPFAVVLGVLFIFHLAQFLAIPLFPLYWVNELKLTDAEISLGNAVFYAVVLLGSTQLVRLTARSNHKQVLLMGVILMSLYPVLTAATTNLPLFLFTAAIGGLAWSLAGGALANYLYDKTPEDERPLHLAWYHLSFNAAILLGALCGPLLAEYTGLTAALVLVAFGRYLAGAALWRWG
jgi:MFS family permease